jgi:hypothetical protein
LQCASARRSTATLDVMKFCAKFPKLCECFAVAAAVSFSAAALADSPAGLARAVNAFAAPSSITAFRYALYDLNGDGIADAVVLITDNRWCGSGGCAMLVFRGTGGGFKLLSKATISNEPILVLPKTVHGWHTLLVSVRGGGIKPGLATMSFKGQGYPRNPTLEPREKHASADGATNLTFVGADGDR